MQQMLYFVLGWLLETFSDFHLGQVEIGTGSSFTCLNDLHPYILYAFGFEKVLHAHQ